MIEPCEEVKRVEQRYEKALDDMEKHYKDVLEQIRDEIEQLYTVDTVYEDVVAVDKTDVLQIIDKYRGNKE